MSILFGLRFFLCVCGMIRRRFPLFSTQTVGKVVFSFVLQMDCCGFSDDDEGYKAWNNNMYFNCTDDNKSAEKCAVPWSCCVLKDVRHPYSILHRMSWRDIIIFASNLFYVMSSKTQGASFQIFHSVLIGKIFLCYQFIFITLNFIALPICTIYNTNEHCVL